MSRVLDSSYSLPYFTQNSSALQAQTLEPDFLHLNPVSTTV